MALNSFFKRKVTTPTIIQMEAAECGAASLAIVLGYYGKYLPLEELRVRCGVTRDGSNALNIIKAATKLGLNAEGLKIDLEELPTLPSPFIVFWNFNHFIVIEGFSKNKVYINDPASGPKEISYEELDRGYTGIAITFEPSKEFVKSGRPLSLWPAIKQRLGKGTLPLTYVFFASLLLLFPQLSIPAITQIFFDNVLGGGELSWETGIILALLLLTLTIGCLTWLQQKCLNRLNIWLSIQFSSRFLWHILRLPVSFYAQRFSGEVANRMSLNDSVTTTLTSSLATSAINSLLILFYAIMMVLYDPLIASIGIGAAFLNLITLWFITRARTDAYARMRQESSKSIGVAIGALQNIETIKAAGNESDFFSRWAGYYAKNLNAQSEIAVKDVVLTTIPSFLQAFSTMLLLGVGAWEILNGDLTIGMLLALQTLLGFFLNPLNQMVTLGSTLQALKVDVSRLNDVLNNRVDPFFIRSESKNNPNERLNGFLQLKNVSFGYSPLAPPLIQNISFDLKPGQRVAFVGPSGCGKSTLAKLITGLYQPWEGEILYDGQKRDAFSPALFTQSLSSVDQQIFLFAGTIRENLSLWDPTLSEEALVHAAKDACIHDEILLRSGKYDSQLVEGGRNLSGGQGQRLEIARSLVLSPSILVMDEATSALDSVTEEQISKNIRRRGCTCVMIAHRLSTIVDCDEILVLDKGKIVQRGSHQDLKKVQGLYQELVLSAGIV